MVEFVWFKSHSNYHSPYDNISRNDEKIRNKNDRPLLHDTNRSNFDSKKNRGIYLVLKKSVCISIINTSLSSTSREDSTKHSELLMNKTGIVNPKHLEETRLLYPIWKQISKVSDKYLSYFYLKCWELKECITL